MLIAIFWIIFPVQQKTDPENRVFGCCDAPGSANIPDIPVYRRTSDTQTLCGSQQPPSRLAQIDQSTGHEQLVGILVQTPVMHLGETEYPLEYRKRMFDHGPDSRPCPLFGFRKQKGEL